MIFVTGGAGFIGSNYIRGWAARHDEPVLNIDALTYAGNLRNLDALNEIHTHQFVQGNILDRALIGNLLTRHQPRAVLHFAAETHVDRSIDSPEAFLQTNVVGSVHLLEEVRRYWETMPVAQRDAFRFIQVSTDEVYGSLGAEDPPFSEATAFAPNSPYSASKAAADHFVRAYHHTYGLPTLVTHCSNNYGPYQYPEKLIPLMIRSALVGDRLPVYGDGSNVRDWLHVDDHCEAIERVLADGRPGQSFAIGGRNEIRNIDIVRALCSLLDELRPRPAGASYSNLVEFVTDRPGHDRRYAIDCSHIGRELGWAPKISFEQGLRQTVQWYLRNEDWLAATNDTAYQSWIQKQYSERESS